MPNFSNAQLEDVYVKEETTYGALITPLGTDAVRIIKSSLKGPQSLLKRGDKNSTRTQNRPIPGGNRSGNVSLDMYVIPSGTPGTAPDGAQMYKNQMGLQTVINTTVAVGTSTTAFSVASATGIRVGTILGIPISGNLEMRPVSAVSGTDITVGIAFSGTPANGAAVKAVVYELADAGASSLNIYSYVPELPRAIVGALFGQSDFSFVDEMLHLRISGIGAESKETSLAAEPTPAYVGLPVARSFGKCFLDGVASDLVDWSLSKNEGDKPRKIAVGSQVTTGITRGKRIVTSNYVVFLTDVTKTLFTTTAKSRNPHSIFVQIGGNVGGTAGYVIAFWMPTTILDIPDFDESEDEIQMQFTAEAYGTGNNELVIAFG